MTLKLEHCASCKAPIYWIAHVKSGRPAPIDVAVSADGNIWINPASTAYCVLSGDALAAARAGEAPLHKNHFATCPNAAQHHRSRP